MHTVLNSNTNQEVKAQDAETIFEAFSRNGTELPHGCLAGTCGVCLIKISDESKKNLNSPKTIEQNTIDALDNQNKQNLRLSCRARIHGDIKFSL